MKTTPDNEADSDEKKSGKKVNILLAAGLVSVIAGLLILVVDYSLFETPLFFLRPGLLLLIGCLVLYRALTVIKKSWAIFLGLFCFVSGIGILFIDSGIISQSLSQLWPCGVILSGLALIPSGLYKYKRLHPAFLVPAIVLALMGCFFLFFSLNVIEEGFKEFAERWWPSLLVFGGCVLIGIFFYVQRSGLHTIADETDENGDDA